MCSFTDWTFKTIPACQVGQSVWNWIHCWNQCVLHSSSNYYDSPTAELKIIPIKSNGNGSHWTYAKCFLSFRLTYNQACFLSVIVSLHKPLHTILDFNGSQSWLLSRTGVEGGRKGACSPSHAFAFKAAGNSMSIRWPKLKPAKVRGGGTRRGNRIRQTNLCKRRYGGRETWQLDAAQAWKHNTNSTPSNSG